MPLLMMKEVDRNLLYLNEGAYTVYVEAADRKGGEAWVRWCRNFERALPLTIYEHFGKPLTHETWERDSKQSMLEITAVNTALAQGRVVLVPGEDLSTALDSVRETTPKLHDRFSQSIVSWRNM